MAQGPGTVLPLRTYLANERWSHLPIVFSSYDFSGQSHTSQSRISDWTHQSGTTLEHKSLWGTLPCCGSPGALGGEDMSLPRLSVVPQDPGYDSQCKLSAGTCENRNADEAQYK